jgi:signal transduction histidine kinase
VVIAQPLTEEQCKITIRFAQVFGLIYTRFLDLETAETSAREAQVESALERVRARAQAMQQPEELKEVARVFRREMGTLGLDELETCDIYIYAESARKSECWFALKDSRTTESKIVSDEFEIDLNDTWAGREMLQFFHSGAKETSITMTGDHQKEWIRYREEKCTSFRGYYGDETPDNSFHLYKFSQGAISQSSASVIPQKSWDLLKRTASVFSLAYSRFKDLTQARIDLQNLKEEKSRAENALRELKATQNQLIQSEKMASLGELTAGIAHEIQNPLNFVNNFSEVNKELIEELKSQKLKLKDEEIDELLNDIATNEEKINHHGKRADAIVKGMLQHSRTSSGVKEPTDINALAEEYLRLAFHGLRAKDKSFNAKFEANLDPSIGKINVVPEDIGRAILNLINNAFDAVNEKAKKNGVGYEPAVWVTTKKINDTVVINVADNGNGIPQKIVDKIFQPFFTTKPTGEGTGLGLSLAYDTIKAHGGEIKVETTEGEGSELIVQFQIQ